MRAAGRVTGSPSAKWARSISYLTCTLSAARKNPPELNSGALTASALGCTSPARSSAARLPASLIVTTSVTRR